MNINVYFPGRPDHALAIPITESFLFQFKESESDHSFKNCLKLFSYLPKPLLSNDFFLYKLDNLYWDGTPQAMVCSSVLTSQHTQTVGFLKNVTLLNLSITSQINDVIIVHIFLVYLCRLINCICVPCRKGGTFQGTYWWHSSTGCDTRFQPGALTMIDWTGALNFPYVSFGKYMMDFMDHMMVGELFIISPHCNLTLQP